VFYGAEEVRTACAELGYWRWRFVRASQGLRELRAAAHTVFQAGASARCIDLSQQPWRKRRAEWMDPDDYRATQQLARQARESEVETIFYESVRDPKHGLCAAVLRPTVFRPKRPITQQTWYLTVAQEAAIWTRERTEFVFRYA
jgi:glycine/D-amino acid oxidase-like deaminating enzyme